MRLSVLVMHNYNITVLCFNLDINECNEDIDICGANARCRNTAGGYKCDCMSGYEKNADGLPCKGEFLCYFLYQSNVILRMELESLIIFYYPHLFNQQNDSNFSICVGLFVILLDKR